MSLSFSYNKLRGRIREKFGTQEKFAEKLGMSKTTLSLKLNNISEFNQKEMFDAMRALELDPALVNEYFFTEEVRKTEQKEAM